MSSPPNRNSASIEAPGSQLQDSLTNFAPFFKPLKLTTPSIRARRQSKPSQSKLPIADTSSKRSAGLLSSTKDQLQESLEAPRIKRVGEDRGIFKDKTENPSNIISQSDKALVMNILNKSPESRSEGEVVFLQQTLMNLKFFLQAEREIRSKAIRGLLRNLKVETFETGQHVFDYDDIGRKFYIIIQGSVYILVKNRGIFKDSEEDSPRKVKKITEDEFKLFMLRDMAEDLKMKKLEHFYPGFVVARSLSAGESFGEIALQAEGNRRRTATVVCKEETVLGVVSIDDYQTYLEKLYEAKHGEAVNLLSNLHLFQHWSKSQILELIPHVEESVSFRNQTIFKEGEEADKLYFLLHGEVELWKKVDLEERSSSTSKMLSPKSASSPLRSKLLRRKKDMRLAIICAGEYIGASGLLDKKSRDHSAITSSTEARFISLTREKFTMFISDTRSLDSLVVYIQQKEIWREKITNNYINIASIYDPMYDSPDRSRVASPTSLLPNISPTNKDKDQQTTLEAATTHKKIDRMLGPSRSSLRPVMNFLEKSPHAIKRLAKGFTPISISTSPINSTPTAMLNRRPGTRDSEKFQILSFDQKNSVKKKFEVDVAFSKLQKKLNKLLEEEEQEARLTSQPDEPYSPKQQVHTEDFSFNFTKKGAPINNPGVAQAENFATEPDTVLKVREDDSPTELKKIKRARSSTKISFQKVPKFKLVKKAGGDKIHFEQGERPANFLHTYMNFVKDAIEGRQNWSTSPPLRIISTISQSPSAQQLIMKKELHQRDIHTSSMGFALAKPKTEDKNEKPNINRVATTNVSKRLYGKVQKAIEYEKLD